MTAEMTADGVPVPTTDETPAPPVAGEGEPEVSPEEEKRKRRKKALLLFLLGLLAMLITIAIWYLIFRQPINPIPIIPESQIPSYSTAIYGASRPAGVAVSVSGDRIYATQTAGERTGIAFDGGGNPVATMAPPAASGTDHALSYTAIDPLTGEVYISDRLASSVYVYGADGEFLRTLALAQSRPGWQPLGLAFDTAGNLYVSDVSGPYQKVLVIDRQANVVRTIGENDKLNFPNGVAVDDDGNVFVADSNNGRLLMYGPDGNLFAQVGRGQTEGNLGLPRGVAVDGSGRVFVADATGQGLFIYRVPSGESNRFEYLGFVGGQGVADGQFMYPNSVAVDARGRIYVADTFNDRVQIWSY